MKTIPLHLLKIEGYWARVIRRPGGCWLWSGPQTKAHGAVYGLVAIAGQAYKVHRVAYMLEHGSIPEGLTIDHKCKVKLCVNPAHLEPVTQSENTRRYHRALPSRVLCKCGNLIHAEGRCQDCHNTYHREYQAKNRERCREIAKRSYEKIGRETRRNRAT